jgi:probable F420-dependent oxidoreductase
MACERGDVTQEPKTESISEEETAVPFKVETILQSLHVDQYAGKGQDAPSIHRMAAAARKIEELGFDGTTTPEAGHDPFLPLVVAAEHTSRITLATNVAIAFPRSPMVVAQIAWDLQQLSRGRFQLGLGTQVKGHNERRYAAPWTAQPGPRLREYVLCLRAMFHTFQNGSKPSYFSGDHYKFTMMPPFFNPGPIDHPRVPIYIAAVNKYMVRLAGELCDGLRLHPIATFRFTKEVILPGIEAGTRKAGRKVSDVDVVGAPFLATASTEDGIQAAKKALKQRIAFYASTRTYHAVLEHHGWKDIGLKLHQLSLEGKWQEMPGLITDDMLEEWAVIATYDELARKLKERCGGIFSTVLIDLPSQLRQDESRFKDTVRALQGT